MKNYWLEVGATNIIHLIEDDQATQEHFPQADYMIGPFKNEEEAKARAATEFNQTDFFTDPFCNHGQGR
jgi:hypothetical protein